MQSFSQHRQLVLNGAMPEIIDITLVEFIQTVFLLLVIVEHSFQVMVKHEQGGTGDKGGWLRPNDDAEIRVQQRGRPN